MCMGECRLQDETGLSKREQHQSIIWSWCHPSSNYHNLIYFPLSSDMGTAVFCAERNDDYYFDYSTWVMSWVLYMQVPNFFSVVQIEFRGWYWCSWTPTNFSTKNETPRVLVSCFWWIEINSYSLIKSPEKKQKCNSVCMILLKMKAKKIPIDTYKT